ncbi:unnamed protein product [Somion occarium]|uniref:Fungal-type protein kinase domain-containing protein n=1 Tax=Somion occarium TaxID=3059160 RepID=A0ABP1CN17_9APHY
MDESTERLPLELWVSTVLGCPVDRIQSWVDIFNKERLCEDGTIGTSVQAHLHAANNEREEALYQPFCVMANRVLAWARDHVPGLPAYPDLLFVRNDPVVVDNGREEKGNRDADRKPDIILISHTTCNDLENRPRYQQTPPRKRHRTTGVDWSDIFSLLELKPFPTSRRAAYLVGLIAAWSSKVRGEEPLPEPSPVASGSRPQRPTPSSLQSPGVPLLSEPGTSSNRLKRKPEPFVTEGANQSRKRPRAKRNYLPEIYENHMARYALEMLSCTRGTRLFFLQCLVVGDVVEFWYCVASGFVRSYQISWVREFEKFAAILVAIACCDYAHFGLDIPNLSPPAPDLSPSIPPMSLTGYSTTMRHPTLDIDVKVTLGSEVFTQYSLVGRHTCVYDVTTEPPISPDPLVIKMSLQSVCRTPEQELLALADGFPVSEHLPKAFMWTNRATEWRLAHGVRGLMFLQNDEDEAYEERCQHFIIFKKYKPIELVLSPCNMDHVFNQLLDCLHKLRYEVNMLHHDISLSNLMYEMRGTVVWLILNDFDLATRLDEHGRPLGATGSHRTGTLPFMSVDLLERPETPHFLRHDLESTFFVALWCAIRLPSGQKSDPSRRDILLSWEQHGLDTILNSKTQLYASHNSFARFVPGKIPFSPGFSRYERWLGRFWSVLFEGYMALGIHQKRISDILTDLRGDDITKEEAEQEIKAIIFDAETFDGKITYARIKAALSLCKGRLAERIPDFVGSA